MARIRHDSTEYAYVPINGPHASSLTVEAFEVKVGSADWAPADIYVTDAGELAALRVRCRWERVPDAAVAKLVGPESTLGELPAGSNPVAVRVTDAPEVPVVAAGAIYVT